MKHSDSRFLPRKASDTPEDVIQKRKKLHTSYCELLRATDSALLAGLVCSCPFGGQEIKT